MTEQPEQPQRRKPQSPASNLTREGKPPCRYFLSTGSTLLDLAISDCFPGGVGSGRITHIYGDNSTAKTVLCQEILGSAQRKGGTAIYEDAEMTLDLQRAEGVFALDVGPWGEEEARLEHLEDAFGDAAEVYPKFVYRVPDSIEGLFDGEIGPACKLIGEGNLKAPVAMGVDTFSALTSKAEAEAELTDGTYGTSRAKQFSTAFRKYILAMSSSQLAVVAIDQTREAIGVSFGKKHTVSGGKAIRYYASTRVMLKHREMLKNRHKQIVGVKIEFEVEKNKLAPPHRKGFFYVVFDYGIDDVRANLEWLDETNKLVAEDGTASDRNIILKKGAWWFWGEDKIGQGIEQAIRWVEDNGRERDLQNEVVRRWRELHRGSGRKRRRHTDAEDEQ